MTLNVNLCITTWIHMNLFLNKTLIIVASTLCLFLKVNMHFFIQIDLNVLGNKKTTMY